MESFEAKLQLKEAELELAKKECEFWKNKYFESLESKTTQVNNMQEELIIGRVGFVKLIHRLIQAETRGPDGLIHLEDLEGLFNDMKLPDELLGRLLEAYKKRGIVSEPEENRFKAILLL